MSDTNVASVAAPPTRRILGVDFFVGSIEQAVARTLAGGLVVAPSAPGLAVDLVHAEVYRRALTTADLVVTDSSWMILLWWARMGEKLPRHSGLKLIRALLAEPALKEEGAIFWVMPSAAALDRNVAWLKQQGFAVRPEDLYVAPYYPAGAISDEALVARLQAVRPRLVILCIGGGVQERLGLMLRERLAYRPGIACLGAAIGFLTGEQPAIPVWADRLFLGWVIRLAHGRQKFWRRCRGAPGLASLIFRYRDQLPKAAWRT